MPTLLIKLKSRLDYRFEPTNKSFFYNVFCLVNLNLMFGITIQTYDPNGREMYMEKKINTRARVRTQKW